MAKLSLCIFKWRTKVQFNLDASFFFKGIDSLYSKIPQVICSFNPCLSERCSEIRSHCLVDLKCKPVFIDVDIRTIPPQCQGEVFLHSKRHESFRRERERERERELQDRDVGIKVQRRLSQSSHL